MLEDVIAIIYYLLFFTNTYYVNNDADQNMNVEVLGMRGLHDK